MCTGINPRCTGLQNKCTGVFIFWLLNNELEVGVDRMGGRQLGFLTIL